ncbi:DUF2135 domain-containing protein [candidate division KSB1 bacterium]|nr:DUF2135 domain-containing protein [candidate division KSB1 bacterium]
MKSHIIYIVFFTLFTQTSITRAQTAPSLVVKDESSDQYLPIKISDLQVDVQVIANLATTTIDMTFYNAQNRELEGHFTFPLGDGQTVSRFAMSVNGKLREGVVVEKAKGRQVFEEIVRGQIDPGLLEWTQGNNFQSRIYPIPAKGHKRIVISYEQELKDTVGAYTYLLPMNFDRVDRFRIKVEIFKQDIQPELTENRLDNFRFEKWRESWLAQAEFTDYIPDKQLAFTVPVMPDRQQIFVYEDQDGKTWFYVHVEPKIQQQPKKIPKKICLLWDASGSAASRDIKKEIELLKKYFAKIGDARINLVVFAHDILSSEKYELDSGRAEKLLERLKNVEYDGGTQLGALDLALYPCDEFLLFSDGLSNFGQEEMILTGTPVTVINTSTSADYSYLKYIAQTTGGNYINLLEADTDRAYELLLSVPYRFLSPDYDPAALSLVTPSMPVETDDNFSIAGCLLQESSTLILNFGFNGRTEYSKKIVLDKKTHKTGSSLIRRIWAQKRIAELDRRYEKNRDEITKLATQYGIVTRNTSLLVLDRLEDYVRHRIIPPQEMQDEYFEIVEHERVQELETEKTHLDQVAEKFRQQIEWWNTAFKFGDGIPKKQQDKAEAEENESFAAPAMGAGEGGRMARGDVAPEPEISVTGQSRMARSEIVLSAAADEADITVAAEKMKDGGSDGDTPVSAITLAKWDPQTPYLAELKKAEKSQSYAVYLAQKSEYTNSSAFFLDVADFFLENEQPELALRVLSNIAEMQLENPQLLRILGYRLLQIGHHEPAVKIFEKVLVMREEEPQSYRDLALAWAGNKQFQKAVDLLYTVVRRPWDDRFPDVELTALHEMNAIIVTCGESLNTSTIEKRLLKNLPVDMRVILTWDADNTDMDLWVIDPNGEKCDYSHRDTYIGGHMSPDFTGGYGPEEFMLKRTQPGKYFIKVNYYGNSQQILAGATTIQVNLFTDFGRKGQKQKSITLRLKDVQEVIDVGEFEMGGEK